MKTYIENHNLLRFFENTCKLHENEGANHKSVIQIFQKTSLFPSIKRAQSKMSPYCEPETTFPNQCPIPCPILSMAQSKIPSGILVLIPIANTTPIRP